MKPQVVYFENGKATICGIPDPEHNCDSMGCSSVEHVLARVVVAPAAGNKLPGSFDAQDWVREWMATIKVTPSIATDEGTMFAWFVNAIMAGWDEHTRQQQASSVL